LTCTWACVFRPSSSASIRTRTNPTGQVAQSKADIEAVRDEIEKTAVEKDDVISAKDDEIRSLTLKMETMAFEFADMLKETLDKMSQRIEISHSSWDRDPSRPPLMNRLKEFSLTDS